MNSKQMFSEIKTILDRIPIDFGGGCSLHKASLMAWLIYEFKLKTTLDIGVYRGRSLFPQAVAHKHGPRGVVYGVDPWSNLEAVENDNVELKEKIDDFAKTTDFNQLFNSVAGLNREWRLTPHCVLVRKTSAHASPWFDEQRIGFDLIHIDGNHDTQRVMEDLLLYLPKLNPGGFVVLDDVSWASVRPAYDLLQGNLKLLYQKVDAEKMNDFAVFWDSNSSFQLRLNRVKLKFAIPK